MARLGMTETPRLAGGSAAVRVVTVALLAGLALWGCGGEPATEPAAEATHEESAMAETPAAPAVEWALAIHGGAGVIDKDISDEERAAYYDALRQALALGRELLAAGEPSVDVVEQVVARLEDLPQFNAGKGAVFTNAGTNELDAAIMDGRDLNCGAISGVTTVKNPIHLARRVMDDSRHIFFVGDGAEAFADQVGVERVESDYYFVQRRWDAFQKALEQEREGDDKHGTVGAVALDREGNLAAATSTGGMTNKRFGRVGDVPVIGAGTYANNATVAISCTGHGEEFIKHNVAHDVSARIAYKGLSVAEAAREVIQGELQPGDGGLIAVGRDGSIVLEFNSPGMFRGAADASGRFEVGIWEEMMPGESGETGDGGGAD